MKLRVYLVMLIIWGVSCHAFAVEESTVAATIKDPADSVYHKADKMPEPVGGIQAIFKNVTYPEKAVKAGKEGKTLVSAVIDESGKVIKTAIKSSSDKVFDMASKDAVKKTLFTPAMVGGKPVKCEIVIPIQFKLDSKHDNQVDEGQPFPIGGMETVMKSVRYPEVAMSSKVQGKVIVQTTVDENGDVIETKILMGVSSELDAEAARAIRSVKFIPGKKDGKPVKADVVIPIMFKLQ